MKKTILILMLTILASFHIASALAGGDERGNGGSAVVCRDDQGKITRAVLLDAYEAEHIRGITPDPDMSNLTAAEQINRISQRIATWEPARADRLKELSGYFLNQAPQIKYVKGPLPLINDTYKQIRLEAGCALEQLAIQTEISEPFNIRIDQEIAASLDSVNSTWLILHESLYRMRNENNPERDSRIVRKIGAKLMSGSEWSKIAKFSDYVEAIYENGEGFRSIQNGQIKCDHLNSDGIKYYSDGLGYIEGCVTLKQAYVYRDPYTQIESLISTTDRDYAWTEFYNGPSKQVKALGVAFSGNGEIQLGPNSWKISPNYKGVSFYPDGGLASLSTAEVYLGPGSRVELPKTINPPNPTQASFVNTLAGYIDYFTCGDSPAYNFSFYPNLTLKSIGYELTKFRAGTTDADCEGVISMNIAMGSLDVRFSGPLQLSFDEQGYLNAGTWLRAGGPQEILLGKHHFDLNQTPLDFYLKEHHFIRALRLAGKSTPGLPSYRNSDDSRRPITPLTKPLAIGDRYADFELGELVYFYPGYAIEAAVLGHDAMLIEARSGKARLYKAKTALLFDKAGRVQETAPVANNDDVTWTVKFRLK